MICRLCPRECGAQRTEQGGGGFCGMPAGIRLARAALHRWEEPPISGTNGSGAVFFSVSISVRTCATYFVCPSAASPAVCAKDETAHG